MTENCIGGYNVQQIIELTVNDINELKEYVADLDRENKEKIFYDIVAFIALNLVCNNDRTSSVIRIALTTMNLVLDAMRISEEDAFEIQSHIERNIENWIGGPEHGKGQRAHYLFYGLRTRIIASAWRSKFPT